MLSLNLDIKIAFSLQYGKSLSIVCFSLVLKKNDSLPKYGKWNNAEMNYRKRFTIL